MNKLTENNFPTDEYLKTLAYDYIHEVYAPIGSTSYIYEDWGNPYDDCTAEAVAESAPRSDEEYIAYHKIVDVTIVNSKVVKRDQKLQEYTVEVEADVTILYSEDEDEEDELIPERRVISCYIGYEGEYFVSDAEE